MQAYPPSSAWRHSHIPSGLRPRLTELHCTGYVIGPAAPSCPHRASAVQPERSGGGASTAMVSLAVTPRMSEFLEEAASCSALPQARRQQRCAVTGCTTAVVTAPQPKEPPFCLGCVQRHVGLAGRRRAACQGAKHAVELLEGARRGHEVGSSGFGARVLAREQPAQESYAKGS